MVKLTYKNRKGIIFLLILMIFLYFNYYRDNLNYNESEISDSTQSFKS
jgi:hypothetical protein